MEGIRIWSLSRLLTRLRQDDCQKLKTKLGYVISNRLARDILERCTLKQIDRQKGNKKVKAGGFFKKMYYSDRDIHTLSLS